VDDARKITKPETCAEPRVNTQLFHGAPFLFAAHLISPALTPIIILNKGSSQREILIGCPIVSRVTWTPKLLFVQHAKQKIIQGNNVV